MRTFDTRLISALAFGLVLGSSGLAVADDAKTTARPGFGVAPEVSAAFAAQRARATAPARLVPEVKVKSTARVVGELAGYVDGVVLIGVAVSPKRQAVLQRLGASSVERRSEVRSHTIFEGRYFRSYSAPNLDPVIFDKLVGQKVRLDVVRTEAGRLFVSAVRAAS